MPDVTEEKTAQTFQALGGSKIEGLNPALLRQVSDAIAGCAISDDAGMSTQTAAGLLVAAFQPADEVEGMLAVQAVAAHFAGQSLQVNGLCGSGAGGECDS